MAGVDDPTPRPRVGMGVVALVAVALLGGVLVLVGISGVLGPAATPTPAPAVSPSAAPSSVVPSFAASPSVGPASSAAGSPPAAPSPAAASLPPSVDPLLLGLLTQEDLPGLSSPLGAQEGTDYDIDDAAFEANEGIRVVSRTWQSLADTGLAGVFDFRMQFPTDAAAAAYLAAAEPVLSEAGSTGQTAVPSPPVIGEDGRVYGLETTGESGPVLLRTYLFRVGPVVAKVVAGGAGVDVATADQLARQAAARIAAAGRPVPGSPRPAVSPTPTPPASAPLPTGEALAALLLEHVPPEIGPSCVPDDQRLWSGELTTLVCTDVAGDVTVTYSGFASVDALDAAFDASLEAIDLAEVAASCDLGPYVGDYEVEDEAVGRVACWTEQGGQAIMWSDERLLILSVAASPTLDPAGLYLWWLGAGPVL